MKPESKTIGQSRTWAHSLCVQLEKSSKLFGFWDTAVEDSRQLPFWQVYRRYGCCRKTLLKKRKEAMESFLDEPIE